MNKHSYSYSKISLYNKCPHKYHKRYVEKVDIFEDSPVFEKGHYMHALLEHYPAAPDFEFKFKEVADKQLEMMEFIGNLARNDRKLRYLLSNDVKIAAEQQFFLTLEGREATGYDDSAFNGKIDYVGQAPNGTILLLDWKSGQSQKKASLDQLKFYAMWAFEHFKNINKVKLYLYFIEQDIFVTEEIDFEEYVAIKNSYVKKVLQIEEDTTFEKRRSSECIWCHFQKECNKINLKRGNNE